MIRNLLKSLVIFLLLLVYGCVPVYRNVNEKETATLSVPANHLGFGYGIGSNILFLDNQGCSNKAFKIERDKAGKEASDLVVPTKNPIDIALMYQQANFICSAQAWMELEPGKFYRTDFHTGVAVTPCGVTVIEVTADGQEIRPVVLHKPFTSGAFRPYVCKSEADWKQLKPQLKE